MVAMGARLLGSDGFWGLICFSIIALGDSSIGFGGSLGGIQPLARNTSRHTGKMGRNNFSISRILLVFNLELLSG
jgi:hypothetical protein